MAYELIETVEVGAGGASSIQFTSIPQDGAHLVLVSHTRMDGANRYTIRINSNSGAIYTDVRLYGNGSSASTEGLASQTSVFGGYSDRITYTSNTFAANETLFSNYTSNSNKSLSTDGALENNDAFGLVSIVAGVMADTNPITSMELIPDNSATFVQYTTASLYKITAA